MAYIGVACLVALLIIVGIWIWAVLMVRRKEMEKKDEIRYLLIRGVDDDDITPTRIIISTKKTAQI